MRDLLRLLAFQVGSEVSYDELAKQLGIHRSTVVKYLDLLEKIFIVYRLGGYAKNLRNEVTRAGKWYFYDNGVRNALIGNFSPLALRQDAGALWENYFISERLKENYNEHGYKSFYFWRTFAQEELDLVEELDGKLSAFEMKWGKAKARLPPKFRQAYPEAELSIINRENYLDYVG